jgi:hypothetical protein
MQCFVIPTEKQKLTVKVGVYSKLPVDLVIKGYDAINTSTVYFERDVEFFQGAKEFDIPMPITPNKLKVCVSDKKSFGIDDVELKYAKVDFLLQKPLRFHSREDEEFYQFAEWFAQESKRLKAGGTIY